MLTSLNRWLGFPHRIFVTTKFSYDNLVEQFNGYRPCFVSVARFTSKNKPFVSYFPFDLDSKLNWRIPYKETRKILQLFQRNNLPHQIVVSGGKGFHFYFDFKETELTNEVRSKIFSIQYSIKEAYKLQSTDKPLFGRKAQLIRLPTTKYVSIRKKKNKKFLLKNDNYCRYLTDEEFLEGIDNITKLSKSPGTIPKLPKSLPTLDEIISITPNYTYREKSDGCLDIDLKPGGTLIPTIEAVALPCLQKIAHKKNPPHPERLELVAWLKLQGYRDMAITTFIKNLSTHGYWDNYNQRDTLNNIISITPRFPTCSILHSTYCKKCPLKKHGNPT